MKTNELLAIKESLNNKVREQDRLLGKKENLLDSLKKLGCSSFVEAEEKIEALEKEISTKEKAFKLALNTFKEKYEELL